MDLTFDHKVLDSAKATRRYFAKFERIIVHLTEVVDLSKSELLITSPEAKMLKEYLEALSNTFTALSYKFLMAHRVQKQADLNFSIDKTESGFPIFRELMQMASDATQAKKHLKSLPSQERLKKDMITHILTEQSAPSQLQYALSQRIYYEYLAEKDLFLSQNHPQIIWVGKDMKAGRRNYLVHWASYDSQTNLPSIYMMELEDTSHRALPHDERRWPRVQSHLMAQAVSSLKLLTIAKGFDQDFNDLHPKLLRRFHLGPMHSHSFTEQHGPLRNVLAGADGEPGLDWALAWTVESLVAETTTKEKVGIFKHAERQVYALNKMDFKMADSGATEIRRSLILPHRAYQVLEEKNKADFDGVRKYVVGGNNKILSYK
ncbi:hypothetical protein [Hellea balneolensis]|uniref:hypothetical protein n=1 Tax=Hellea balneolensis TaxID=287478 RepID=UPI0003F644E2|nr:hypothetical protein [Hellea balneolensis]